MNKLTHILFSAALALVFASCSSDTKEAEQQPNANKTDTTAIVLQGARQCARLYTNAYEIHKIITLSDEPRLKGKILFFAVDMKLPTGDRKIAVPIDVSVRASIDLSKLAEADIAHNGTGIRISLPEPEITVTATKIDNKSVREYVGAFRSSFSDEELVGMTRQGRDSIVAHLDKAQIVEDARLSAANTLLPMLHKLGFSPENTSVEFRQDFKEKDITLIMK